MPTFVNPVMESVGASVMRLAILEDNHEHAELLHEWLTAAGHACHGYASGKQFIKDAGRESFDLMLLDWQVPDLDGLQVLRWVRANVAEHVPVLFLTGRNAEEDIVQALSNGADDYVIKPPRRMELLARIEALTRRGKPSGNDEVLEYPPYRIDTARRTVSVHGTDVPLTHKEYDLILFLFSNVGRLVSRGHLEETVWGRGDEILSRSLDTHLSRIRRKLALNPENGYRITPVYSHGYRLERVKRGDDVQ
ncbi:MAG: response regulator transcription factor [Gammaproteobacteria bacterium]|nr:response regulator transcription factor [Gammaproteobacteria bacterium]MDH3411638.1 response regulator transcription factor [Gammaproteobacteria bacterium]